MTKRDSLYEQYITERVNQSILWKEFGFIIYKITDQECFIVDMFIQKSARQTDAKREILDSISRIAIQSQCKVLTGNIHLSDAGATHTLKAALSYGFKVAKSGQDVLLIAKELKEQNNG